MVTEGEKGGTVEITCPACGDDVGMPDDAVLGEVIWCYSCGVELEVVSLDPPRVVLFEEEEK